MKAYNSRKYFSMSLYKYNLKFGLSYIWIGLKLKKKKPWGLYFSKALFEGLIFGGAYIWREIFVSKSIGLAYSWKEIYVSNLQIGLPDTRL